MDQAPEEPPAVRPVPDKADQWAWMNESEPAEDVDVSGIRVTAILVNHNGAAWLPAALDSLDSLTVKPTRMIAVDNGSTDTSLGLLRNAGIVETVLEGRTQDGFGAGVARALQASPADTEWLWLLHDDVVVDPKSLENLLIGSVKHQNADILGPKLLQPGDGDGPRRIGELGVSISDTGRRELALSPGEIDQQQHSSRRVLGVSTCGMLVKRSVWEALGGLAPELPVFRDGVEFGWRAGLAGHRVITCPEAEITHRQAGRAGLRRSGIIGSDPDSTDRLYALRTVAAHRPSAGIRFRLIIGSLLRALGFLLAKAPGRAGGEMSALRSFLNGPQVLALRARIPKSPDQGAIDTVETLRPARWSGVQAAADSVAIEVGDRWQDAFGPGDDTETSIDELTGDDFAGGPAPRRGPFSNPIALTFVALIVLALVAARSLIGPGFLAADLMLPARSTLADAYQAYLAPIVGAPGISAPPWIGWTALASTLTFGRPAWLIWIGFVLVVPIAFVSALVFLRRMVEDRRIRIPAAALYAVLPVLLAGVNRGLVAMLVFAVLLPWLALAVRALALRRTTGPEAWRSAWATGLLLTVLVSFEPAFGLIAGLGLAVIAVANRADRTKILRVVVAFGVPVVLLAPWWPAIMNNWSRLLVGPDAGLQDLVVEPVWRLFLGLTPGPGLAPFWVAAAIFGVIWGLALLAIVLRGDTPVVAAWGVALTSLGLTVLLSRQLATTLPQGTRVRPDVTTFLLVAFAALLLAGALGVARAVAGAPRTAPVPARLGAGVLVGVLVVTLVGSVTWWVWGGVRGPVHRTGQDALAPYIRNAMLSDAETRTLAVDLTGDDVRWSLIAGDQLRLGDTDRGLAFAGSGSMQVRTRSLVARLLSGTGDEQIAGDLANLAVSNVWVTGATEEERSSINNTPGLGAASGDETATVWSVPMTTGRMAVTGPEPVVLAGGWSRSAVADLPASVAHRELVIAEATDPRWRVTFNGNQLTAEEHADRTTFSIPPNPGRLEVSLSDPFRPWLALAQLVGVGALLVLSAPSLAGARLRRAEGRQE